MTFTLGGLGEITGDTVQTKTYTDAPHSNRPYYRFRNVPYAQPFQRCRYFWMTRSKLLAIVKLAMNKLSIFLYLMYLFHNLSYGKYFSDIFRNTFILTYNMMFEFLLLKGSINLNYGTQTPP